MKPILHSVIDTISRERSEIQRQEEFLSQCREEKDVPEELCEAVQEAIECQNTVVTRCEEVLTKMLSESEKEEE